MAMRAFCLLEMSYLSSKTALKLRFQKWLHSSVITNSSEKREGKREGEGKEEWDSFPVLNKTEEELSTTPSGRVSLHLLPQVGSCGHFKGNSCRCGNVDI
jgi:hypothetical protein